jgi:hypothetical protein
MVFNFNGDRAVQELALDRAEGILEHGIPDLAERHRRMMAEQIDVTDFVVRVVHNHAASP